MANTQEDEAIMAAMDAMEAQPSGEAEEPWSQEDYRWSSQRSAEDAPVAPPQKPQKLWWHTQQDDPAHVEASLAAITDATGLDFAAVRRLWDKTRRVAEDADVSYDDSVTAFGELALACKECDTSPDAVPANAVVVINSVRRRGNDNGVKRAIETLVGRRASPPRPSPPKRPPPSPPKQRKSPPKRPRPASAAAAPTAALARRPTPRELGTNPRALGTNPRALAARAQPPPPPPARQTIPGKRVFLLGVLTQSRPRASSRVAAAGGTVAKTVDESVSYVVLGDNLADGRPVECSASYQNAQRLGIKLMSEQEFFAML